MQQRPTARKQVCSPEATHQLFVETFILWPVFPTGTQKTGGEFFAVGLKKKLFLSFTLRLKKCFSF